MFLARYAAAAWLFSFIVVFGASDAAGSLDRWLPGTPGDLAFQTSGFVRVNAYPRPDRVGVHAAPDGAYGLNVRWDQGTEDHWLIEEQRYAIDAIVAGLAYHRQDLLDRGEAIFNWGFRHEQPDGSFACSNRFHSTSFFVEAAAHAALLIKASDLASQNEDWVRAAASHLRASARWMMAPENALHGQQHDAPYTHRDYLDAAAIGETGTLLHDQGMIRASRTYITRGLAKQDRSGFNPEKGGADTSYQAVGLLLAQTYYSLVADEAVRAQMRPMIERGLEWLAARVRPDGTVDQSGNTRTGLGQERAPQGALKTMSYGSAFRAMYYWAMITGDQRWAGFAGALVRGQQIENAERRGVAVSG